MALLHLERPVAHPELAALRAERVRALIRAVRAGTYRPSPDAVARALLRRRGLHCPPDALADRG